MEEQEQKQYEPIEDYGIIGDLHTVALISMQGSIDFMSFTRFDSPTIFAAMLDKDKGGSFSIHPLHDHVVCKQQYLPDTAILLTRFLSDSGIGELADYMPAMAEEAHCAVVRRITVVKGSMTFEAKCAPRFNYARTPHKVAADKEELCFETADKAFSARLVTNIPYEVKDNDVYATFTLQQGETGYFILESAPNKQQRDGEAAAYVEDTYKRTINFWQNWVEQSTYKGRWREMVQRSAITLKLLTSNKFGSVIAAPTCSLPETIGGGRNWDYRYTWIRDAAFTMYAFLRLGFKNEAIAFISWIKEQCMNKDLQLMYGVDGNTDLGEYTLDHFSGYRDSQPVRIGNKAHEQFQLDIYGELMDTVYLFNTHVRAITYEFWLELQKQVRCVIKNWRKPDHGIWEIRNERKEFLHSRVMCWVAMDRAIKIAEDRSFPYPLAEWHEVRDDIYKDVYDNFWNEEKQAYVQHKGSESVDASALLMPLVRFISPEEQRWKTTLEAIERELGADIFVYRYRNNLEKIDGLEGDEGTFTMCSLWYIECLAKGGQVEKAREYFEKMLGYANHVGLFAEQLGPRGEHLGNYPQAFTHLALISAAVELDKKLEQAYHTAP